MEENQSIWENLILFKIQKFLIKGERLMNEQPVQIEQKEVIENKSKVEPVTKRNKIGRNQKCFCGSGKKYKKCCINKRQEIKNIR